MSMFSSRPPFNDDPKPWKPITRNERYSSQWDAGLRYFPRPEFDRLQHNPTNPIIAEFRDDVALNPTIPVGHIALVWVSRDLIALEVAPATQAHIDHARRVLSRLANLTKEETA